QPEWRNVFRYVFPFPPVTSSVELPQSASNPRPAQERPPPAQGGYGDQAASTMAGAGSWVSCPMSATDFRDLRKRFYRRGVGIHTARDSPTAVVRAPDGGRRAAETTKPAVRGGTAGVVKRKARLDRELVGLAGIPQPGTDRHVGGVVALGDDGV